MASALFEQTVFEREYMAPHVTCQRHEKNSSCDIRAIAPVLLSEKCEWFDGVVVLKLDCI